MTVISVENLSKSYRLGQIGTGRLVDDLRVWWAKTRGKPNPLLKIGQKDHGNRNGETIWALEDVSFEVNQGEVLGIIGRNGAGKSTTLKILSRITAPTSGHVKVKGRIASLLEVGTGFHPELTGRENVYLNGAILGMKKMEIDRKFDEIVAFSEVEQFIDTPVKRYSSGMYVRLAFAVAAHLDPEILLVDEVLAVGDAVFQKKCLGKMGDVAKGGRTVLFVSHNMTAIQTLCRRAIWIETGTLREDGDPAGMISRYLQFGASTVVCQEWKDPATAPGNDKVRMRRVRLAPEGDDDVISVHTPFRMEFEFWNNTPGARLHFSMHLYNAAGLMILNSGSGPIVAPEGLMKGVCSIPGDFLNDGTHRVMIMIVQDCTRPIYQLDDAMVFDVRDAEREQGYLGKWPGVVRPTLRWSVGASESSSNRQSS